jgi:D-glycero-D-manno-heptose 1,7-bisphosphate phosphatase
MKKLHHLYPAIFLDRDGVIIENRADYVRDWKDVEIIPGVVQALAQIAVHPWKIVMVTNQSAIGRGIISYQTAQAINQQLVAELEKAGCRMDGVFMCPHAPNANCDCRKPRPGLLLQATQALDIDLSLSVMIGDAWSDLQAGQAAGVNQLVLLRTGRGSDQLALPPPVELRSWMVYENLPQALQAFFPDV